MGWASWNSFSNSIDAKIAMQQAQAMVSTGMKSAGYSYVLLDEGWWRGQRDAEGSIVVDPDQWPALGPGERAGEMSNIVRYIHSLGLKAAGYTDAGLGGCGTWYPDSGPKTPGTGSERHYEQDFLQFARWDFDYVKVDWCGGDHENLDPYLQYSEVARAIQRAEASTGHPLFYSICEWGQQSPWTWAPGIGGLPGVMWRTSGDIVDPIVDDSDPKHVKLSVSLENVFGNFDAGMHPEAQHTGFYNDLDMMVLGMRGMSLADDRVHLSLWAVSGAPLMVGADLKKLTNEQIATLTNPEVLAVNQDALGLQCVKVGEAAPGLQIWAKPLAQPGSRAVVLLNRTNAAASISANWSKMALNGSSPVAVRDVWAKKDLGAHADAFTAEVPARQAVMLVVHGRDAEPATYRAPSSQDRSTTFRKVKSSGSTAYVRVLYANHSDATLFAELRINGGTATRVAFPPSRQGRLSAVALELNLKASTSDNVLEFTSDHDSGLSLDSILVSPWQ